MPLVPFIIGAAIGGVAVYILKKDKKSEKKIAKTKIVEKEK